MFVRQSKYKKIALLYLGAIFLAFHYYFVIYINSSFISQYFDERFLGILYTLGAALTIYLLYKMPTYFRKHSVRQTTLLLIATEALALFGLGVAHNPYMLIALFVVHQAMPPLLLYCLDIFLERESPEGETGLIRALYLTFMNIVLVASPFLTGYIISCWSFNVVYILASLFLIPLSLIILIGFKRQDHTHYETIHFTTTLLEFHRKKDIRTIVVINFLLQLFYAIMVVYTPIYLSKYIGFSWQEIGIIFTIMLLPFVLFELPLGRLADKRLGEKEILVTGFGIMILATCLVGFMDTRSIWLWSTLLFLTRVGASFVEIATDTYFFKKVTQKNTDLISFYRGMIPVSYIVAPLIASQIIIFLGIHFVFVFLSFILFAGIFYSIKLRDTL